MIRGKYFDKISIFSNWGLVFAGSFLLVFQLIGFFNANDHHHEPTNNLQENNHHHHDH